MKKFIKRLLVILLIIIPATITSSSSTILKQTEKDTIVSVTPIQLKETNLIFSEHKKLLTENALLYEQINNYKESISLLVKKDSLRESQINTYKDWNDSLNKSLNNKNKKLRLWKIGGITVSSSLVILLLLK